jgi:hypothetical protein
MSSSESTLTAHDVERIVADLEAHFGDFSALVRQERELPAPDAVQRLMTVAMKLFVAHHERGERFDPVGPDVGATEVAIMASAMLEAVNLEVFELSIWHGLSTAAAGDREGTGQMGEEGRA